MWLKCGFQKVQQAGLTRLFCADADFCPLLVYLFLDREQLIPKISSKACFSFLRVLIFGSLYLHFNKMNFEDSRANLWMLCDESFNEGKLLYGINVRFADDTK